MGLDFPPFDHTDGLDAPDNFISAAGDVVPNGTVRSFFVVVSTPSVQLFGGIFEAHEPVSVQAFRPEPAVEGLDKRVAGWFSKP